MHSIIRRRGDVLRAALLVLGAIAALASACDDSPADTPAGATFTIATPADDFTIRVTDAATIEALEQRLADGTVGVILGNLVEGSGGFNAPWSWHLDPASVRAVDLAIEVCDGTPDMVEADLDYWLELGQYCPWGARVAARID